MDISEAMRTRQIRSVPSSRSVKFSLVEICGVLSADLPGKVLIFILIMISFLVRTAAAATQSIKLSTGSSIELNIVSKAGVKASIKSCISTLKSMSTIATVVKLDVRRKQIKRKREEKIMK